MSRKPLVTVAILSIYFLCINNAVAQETITIPDTLQGWTYSWVAGVNGNQSTFSNWSQGGVNSVSATGLSLLSGKYRNGQFGYGFVINLRYGKANIEDQGTRKTDDRIAFRNRFSWNLGAESSFFNVFTVLMFQSQFDKGFEYEKGPNGEDIKISQFFAPAYFTENVGIAYQPKPFISLEGGIGLKQTVVSIDELAPLYGITDGSNFRSEGGITTGISFEKEVMQNMILNSQFGTFTNFNRTIDETDISFANQITGKVNKFVSVSLQFELLYDADFSREIQTKQVLGLGVTVNLM